MLGCAYVLADGSGEAREAASGDKIMSQSMRKRCGVYNIAKASMLAKPTCQAALGMEHKNCGPQNTLPIQHRKDGCLYTMDASNEMVRIILETGLKRCLEALRAGVPKAADRMDE